MAQLEKFIKVTQEQYNTLANGGTVGNHTGINPNFIYLVENNGGDTPSAGGATVITKDIYMSDFVEDGWRWGGDIEITSEESALLTDPNSQVVVQINILDDDDDLIYVDYLYKASQLSMLMNMTYYTNNMSAMSAYDVSGTEVISLIAVFQGRDYLTYMMCNKSMMYGNHEIKLDQSAMTNNQFELNDSIYHAALSGFPVKIGDLYLRLTYVNSDGTFGLSSYDAENGSWLNFKMTAAPTISVDGNISATFALDTNDTANPYAIGSSEGGSVDETYVSDALSNFLADEIEPKLEDKQDTLVSGTNIKTINGTSILGSGNISIEGGSGSGTTVEANPTDLATDVLNKLKVAGVTYSLPSGGGSGGETSKLVIQKTTELTDYSFEDITFTVEEFTQLFESNNCELRIATPNDVLIMTKSQLIDLDGAYGVSFESSHLSLSIFDGVGLILTLASDMSTGVELLSTAISGDGGSIDTSEFATKDELATKQNTLVSGTNIKTINNESIVGSGNLSFKTINEQSLTGTGNIQITSTTPVSSLPEATRAEYYKHNIYFHDGHFKALVNTPTATYSRETLETPLLDKNLCAAVTIGDTIYVTQNNRRVCKFNPLTETYEYITASGKMPIIQTASAGVTAIGENIYYVGVSESIYKYNISTNTGEVLSVKLPFLHMWGCIASVGDNIYVIGGTNHNTTTLDTMIKIDTVNLTVETLAVTLPQTLFGTCACTIGTDIYILGGRTDGASTTIQKTVYKFNTVDQTITQCGNLTYGLDKFGIATIGTDIYTFGGQQLTSSHSYDYTNYIYKYDTNTNTCTRINKYIEHAATSISAATYGNKIYLFGGEGRFDGTNWEATNSIQVFDTQTNSYSYKSLKFED